MKKNQMILLCGAAAASAAVNGIFGTGGGMVLVPLLGLLHISKEQVFPVCVSIILPICAVSLLVGGSFPLAEASPYLPGAVIGGLLAGRFGEKIPAKWLHRGLGVLILFGGIRYLW